MHLACKLEIVLGLSSALILLTFRWTHLSSLSLLLPLKTKTKMKQSKTKQTKKNALDNVKSYSFESFYKNTESSGHFNSLVCHFNFSFFLAPNKEGWQGQREQDGGQLLVCLDITVNKTCSPIIWTLRSWWEYGNSK